MASESAELDFLRYAWKRLDNLLGPASREALYELISDYETSTKRAYPYTIPNWIADIDADSLSKTWAYAQDASEIKNQLESLREDYLDGDAGVDDVELADIYEYLVCIFNGFHNRKPYEFTTDITWINTILAAGTDLGIIDLHKPLDLVEVKGKGWTIAHEPLKANLSEDFETDELHGSLVVTTLHFKKDRAEAAEYWSKLPASWRTFN